MNEPEILCDIRHGVAFVTLNRPAALNALSLTMIAELRATLRRCATDPEVRAVLLKGAGAKAFCAGGDIRSLYRSRQDSGSLHRQFFVAEYQLDFMLYSYPKPYIVLLDGITMGGGMGLAQGSTWRIVGERTRIAMPEVGIGLFPDVGASYFLSRLPGSLGLYLALTGVPIGGVDALYAGLADVYLAPQAVASLETDLEALIGRSGIAATSANINRELRTFFDAADAMGAAGTAGGADAAGGPGPPRSSLRALHCAIDLHFSATSVAGILASLDAERREEYADWARRTAEVMRTRSPTMLAVALRQLERGKSLGLADCFRMELGMVEQCFHQGDFMEGVRALLIDKDHAPRWTPAQLRDVTEASVEAFFTKRWEAADNPLADLGEMR